MSTPFRLSRIVYQLATAQNCLAPQKNAGNILNSTFEDSAIFFYRLALIPQSPPPSSKDSYLTLQQIVYSFRKRLADAFRFVQLCRSSLCRSLISGAAIRASSEHNFWKHYGVQEKFSVRYRYLGFRGSYSFLSYAILSLVCQMTCLKQPVGKEHANLHV